MTSCEVFGCQGHAAPTPAEKKRIDAMDRVTREILENQLAIMRALRYLNGVPSRTEEHLQERTEITRKMLEGKS